MLPDRFPPGTRFWECAGIPVTSWEESFPGNFVVRAWDTPSRPFRLTTLNSDGAPISEQEFRELAAGFASAVVDEYEPPDEEALLQGLKDVHLEQWCKWVLARRAGLTEEDACVVWPNEPDALLSETVDSCKQFDERVAAGEFELKVLSAMDLERDGPPGDDWIEWNPSNSCFDGWRGRVFFRPDFSEHL